MLIAGMDEAGRGCVIGPLALCVAAVEEDAQAELKELGAKDSKLLSPAAREKLYRELKPRLVTHSCVHVEATELNTLMETLSLNEIEAMAAAKAVSKLKSKPGRLYADSCDGIADRFSARLRGRLKPGFEAMEIISEHKADYNYPIVSAASIIAKVERDREIERIKKEVGCDFGSGYTSDPRTIAFLKERLADPEVRKYVRSKWKTVGNLGQTKLSDSF